LWNKFDLAAYLMCARQAKAPEDGACASAKATPCEPVHMSKCARQAKAPEDGTCASAKATPCEPLYMSKSGLKTNLERQKMANASTQGLSILPARLAQAHPPAAGGQPFPALWQHHAFLATDHPAIQFANPALQSYGAEVVPTGAHPPAC